MKEIKMKVKNVKEIKTKDIKKSQLKSSELKRQQVYNRVSGYLREANSKNK